MLITARANHGPTDDRGVVGHARSTDLIHWTAQPPLSQPGAGFGHIEVNQVEIVNGRPVLLFSCLRQELSERHRAYAGTGGIWALPCESITGPFDIAQARPLTDERLYSGRLIRDRDDRWVMLAFHNRGQDGEFIGTLSDPIPVGWINQDRNLLTSASSTQPPPPPSQRHRPDSTPTQVAAPSRYLPDQATAGVQVHHA